MMTKSNYINPETIWQVAESAYEHNQRYYGSAEMKLEELVDAPKHVQKNVIRDVKAVLLGNRTAEDLHDAWRDRKRTAKYGKNCYWSDVECSDFVDCPTALVLFSNLSEEDQGGYLTFVDCVKNTYKHLTQQPQAEESIVVGSKTLGLLLATARHHSVSHYERRGQWTVALHFRNQEDAEAFKQAVTDVK